MYGPVESRERLDAGTARAGRASTETSPTADGRARATRTSAFGEAAANDVWAIGQSANIVHWNGSSWSALSGPAIYHNFSTLGCCTPLTAIWGDAQNDVWAVGAAGSLLYFDGSSWSQLDTTIASDLYAVYGTSGMGPLAVGSEGVVLNLTPTTATSAGSNVAPATVAAVFSVSEDDVWAVGDQGTMAHYRGGAWSAVKPVSTSLLEGVWGAASNDVWVVGDAGTILHWNGSTWSPVADGLSTTVEHSAVWGAGPKDVWAVGAFGTLVHWDGSAWSSSSAGSIGTEPLYGVWGSATNDVWIVGARGTLGHWNGTLWSTADPKTFDDLEAVSGRSATDVWAVGETGTAVHFDGTSWTPSTTPTLSTLYSVWGRASPSEVWAVGAEGTALKWDGMSWTASATSWNRAPPRARWEQRRRLGDRSRGRHPAPLAKVEMRTSARSRPRFFPTSSRRARATSSPCQRWPHRTFSRAAGTVRIGERVRQLHDGLRAVAGQLEDFARLEEDMLASVLLARRASSSPGPPRRTPSCSSPSSCRGHRGKRAQALPSAREVRDDAYLVLPQMTD